MLGKRLMRPPARPPGEPVDKCMARAIQPEPRARHRMVTWAGLRDVTILSLSLTLGILATMVSWACHLDAATPIHSGDLEAAPDPPYAPSSTHGATLAAPGDITALSDRHALPRLPPDLPAAYEDEEYADICELCDVPLISCEQHQQGALHHDREDRQRALVRAGSLALTPADIEAALVIVGRACSERLRSTRTLPPELANVRLSDDEM
ncbi:hypothetical protein HPB47_008288 [Ixodes persulcatus]|uniref:Uncharacterized protein n=1 Tax=Ixodes persulcatus TaxID=34615 RepID=A0AC60P546_IXOPE|nr:hypothetical protein HPB47_008288 [Ixodes persulcatus]